MALGGRHSSSIYEDNTVYIFKATSTTPFPCLLNPTPDMEVSDKAHNFLSQYLLLL
jgi:hypothetical protein